MRLDQFLKEKGYFESRAKAQYEIKEGNIKVNGITILKPSFEVTSNDHIEVLEGTLEYVSKGGLKLEKALDAYQIDVNGKTCLDIGASTGGFTHCLINRGANLVYALDVGSLQLHESLRNNPKVISLENTNFLTYDLSNLSKIDIIVIDVSFIKVETILERIIKYFKDVTVVFLIKPQFELGHIYMKNGVVKDEKMRQYAIKQITSFIEQYNIKLSPVIESPIKGGSGNIEYLSSFKL